MSRPDGRRMTHAGVVIGLGEVLGKISTLVLFSVVARSVGVSDFGVFSFGLGLGLMLASLVSLGMDQRLVQLAGGDPDSLVARLSSLLALRLAGCAVLVLGVVAVVPRVVEDGTTQVVVVIMTLSGCLDALTAAYQAAATARFVQNGPAVVLTLQRFIALLLVLLAFRLEVGIIEVSAAYALASVAGLALMSFSTRLQAGASASPRAVSREHITDFLRSVKVTGVNDVVSMALFRVDVVMLAMLAGTAAVGEYTAAYRLLETVLFVSWSIARVILPVLADVGTSERERSRTVSTAVVVVATLYLPYAAVLLARGGDLVALLFGAPFVNEGIVWALALAPLAFGLAQMGINALLALRPDPVVLGASLGALVTNVALNILLIPIWGPVAAALATTLSYGLQATIVLTALSGRGMAVRSVRASLLSAAAGSVVAGLVMVPPVTPLLSIALGAVAFLGVWWWALWRWDRPMHTLVLTALSPRVP